MVDVNCDMGEGYGIYSFGNDELVMPYITQANIACGYHASDHNHMRRTVELAKKYGVKVGAHFSYPDMQGFGRRKLQISTDELTNCIIYQVGALKGFLDVAGIPLSHLKPHGALYGVAASDKSVAEAIAEVASFYRVPLFGLSNTFHETECMARNVTFKAEFFADLEYDDNGGLIISTVHEGVSVEDSVSRCIRAVTERVVSSENGRDLTVDIDTICIHSDTPNAPEVAKLLHSKLLEKKLLSNQVN